MVFYKIYLKVMDIYALTDKAILVQIGKKLKEARVAQNMSQKTLATASGMSMFSISQMENGHNTSLLSIIMVLRALNRFDVLEGLFQEPVLSPIAYSEYLRKHKPRKRAYKFSDKQQDSLVAEPQAQYFRWDKD